MMFCMSNQFTPSDRQRKETGSLLRKWQLLLFLNSWKLKPRYATENDKSNGYTTRADVEADPHYHTATITFYPHFFQEKDAWAREQTVVHELTHCLVESMQEQIKDLQYGKLVTNRHRIETMERSVTWIANALHSLDADRQEWIRKATKRKRR